MKKNNMSTKFSQLLVCSVIIILASCSGTRNIPDGDLLYVGAKIEVNGEKTSKRQRKGIKSELQKLVRPKPNKSFLGMRPEIFFYNLAGEVKKDKGFRYWIKYKLGKEPVLFSKVDLEFNKEIIQNYVENNGYFNAVTATDSTRKGKKGIADYEVKLATQYTLKNIVFPTDSTLISKQIKLQEPESVLKIEAPYNLDNIKLERSRIDSKLKEVGFYYFNEDYIIVQVDSTVGNHQVELLLKVKEQTPAVAQKQYRINNIYVYPNFKVNKDTASVKSEDVVYYKDFTIIDNGEMFRPIIFDKTLYFEKEDLYNRTNHNLSLNRLISLGNFKFVKNEFKVNDTLTDHLDTYYYLTPLPKKSLRAEALAKSNSANYSGTELNINWSNRNTFRASELLTISAFGGFEVQVSGQNNGFNIFRFGGETSLVWPRFITPFNMSSGSGYVPRTKALLNYEYQSRSKLYALQTFNTSFGYIWKENQRKEHNLKVLDITYALSSNISDLYRSQIVANPSLERIIEKQLIFGPTYSYTFTNTMYEKMKNTFYFKGGVDLSGNVTGLILGAKDAENPKKVLGAPFSQYIKVEAELRHYLKLGGEAMIASRIIVGSGLPYGNSKELPFIKQYFIGGTNSVRAFRARSVGPGSFDGATATSEFLPDQSGDLKLEFNTEFRGKIYNFVKGAVFVDGGNIWLLNENAEKPGAKISKDFISQLALGVGAGLRFDFSFLVLRTDLAFPIRKPYLPKGERWVIGDTNFGNGSWRKENLIFNLAIGYPF